MSRRAIMGIFAGSAAFALSGCGSYGDNSYRARVTVEIETSAGLKRGSSVMEVHASKQLQIIAGQTSGASGLRGEAVVVDTPNGPIFMLLKSAHSANSFAGEMTVALATEAEGGIDNYVAAVRRLGGWFSGTATAELPREDWPMMVRFKDINDPKSVEAVDPAAIGVKRIMLETTSDDVTTGIEKRLGWLPNQNGSFVRRLSVPDPTNPPIAAMLNKRDFSTEIK
jgi:hypothetical protein